MIQGEWVVKRHWPYILLLVMVIAVAFRGVLFSGQGLMASLGGPGVTARGPVDAAAPTSVPVADAVAAYIDEPLAVYSAKLFDRGEWPWWNPHNGLGVPLQGNWQTSIGNPLRLLAHWFPDSPWIFDFTYLLRLLIGATGALLLASRLGLPLPAAFGAGVAFGLTGYFLRYLQMHHLNAEVWLPWLWLTADQLARRPRWTSLFGHGFVVYCVVTGGNPQPALLAAVATGLFCLWRWQQWGWAGFLRVVLCSVPPVLLASFYWIGGLEYVAESVHHHDTSFGGDAFTAAGALGLFLPKGYHLGHFGSVAPYIGFLTFLLAVMGVGRGLGKSAFLWGLLLLFGGKILGWWGTGWLGDLPGFSLVKLWKYLYPVAALALALLCGAGIAAVLAGTVSARRFLVSAAVALAALVILVAAALGAEEASPRDGQGRPYIEFVGWTALVWPVALVVFMGWATVFVRSTLRVVLVVGLLVTELVLAVPGDWMPRHDPFAKPDFIKALQRKDRPGSFRTFGLLGVLIPNQNAVFGIDDIRLHDGVFPRRYGEFVKRFLNPNVRHWPVFTGSDVGEQAQDTVTTGRDFNLMLLHQGVAEDIGASVKIDPFDSGYGRYLDLVNVKYLIFPVPADESGGARFREHARLLAASPQFDLFHEDEDAVVLERKTVLKRAFFPKRVEAVNDMEAAFEKMAAPEFDPADVAFLEASGLDVVDGSSIGAARFDEEKSSSTSFEFNVRTDSRRWVVISVYPYPGMRAEIAHRVQGKEVVESAEIVPADGALSAVLLPQGKCRLRLVYEPSFLWRARVLMLLGALGLLGMALWMVRNPSPVD